jgi:hypothetical protein
MDFSTINIKALRRLPVYNLPPSYTLQRDPGNGCFLDPPGYPSYFTRNVYTRYGNNPHKGVLTVISYQGTHYVVEHSDDWKGGGWDEYRAKVDARLRRLWNPLPLEHPRTQAWIDYCIGYFDHCFIDPRTGKTECGSWVTNENMWDILDALGVEYSQALKEKVLRIEEASKLQYLHVEPEYLEGSEELEYLKLDNLIYAKTNKDTHYIQEWYPEYEYDGNRKGSYGAGGVGSWWERLSSRPAPSECPGEAWQRHPVNGTWCQVCGWKSETIQEEA